MENWIKSLENRIQELEEEREKIVREMSELKPLIGCIEYKYVLNKIGKKYYYFYLRRLVDGKLRSIYLGKSIPEGLIKAREDRYRLKVLKEQLKKIERQIRSIERILRKNVRENKDF